MDRRSFLWGLGGGLGGVALAHLLGMDGLLPKAVAAVKPVGVGAHHVPKAQRVVQLFMSGAASQVDTFDYKPLLHQRAGQPFEPGGKVELFQSDPGVVMPSPWEWKQYGQSGKWVSGLLPNLAQCVDDMAFLPAMVAKSNVHGPATFMQSTGFVLPGFPSFGAWVSYGLGNLNENLPTFVVLPDTRGFAPGGPKNWAAGFLPSAHQGTLIRPSRPNPIADLFPPADSYVTPESDADGLEALAAINRIHQQERAGDTRLDAPAIERARSHGPAGRD